MDTNTLDLETIILTETGTNTGVFRNITGLPTSATSGLGQQDGILNVSPGDTLSVSYTDPIYRRQRERDTAAISVSHAEQAALFERQQLDQWHAGFEPHGPGRLRSRPDAHAAWTLAAAAAARHCGGFNQHGRCGTRRQQDPDDFTYHRLGGNRLMLVGVSLQVGGERRDLRR